MILRGPFSLFLLFSVLLTLHGQQPPPRPAETQKPATPQTNSAETEAQDVVRITTNLVQVDAVVTRDGKQVTDLQADDFQIFEDGKAQAITNFSFISNVPATAATRPAPERKAADRNAPPVLPAKINVNDQRRIVALVIDDLGLGFETIPGLKTQIRKVLDGLLPNDLVAIIRTGGDVGALQQFTNDKRVLRNALDHLRWNPCSRVGVLINPPAGAESYNVGVCSQRSTSTLKSLRFILRGMGYLPGRKSMVIFSDYLPIEDQQPTAATKSINGPEAQTEGVLPDAPMMPESSLNLYGQLQRLAELAIRSSVVIYGVDTRGLRTTGFNAADAVNAPNNIGPNMTAIQRQVTQIMLNRSATLIRGREGADLIAKQTGGFLVSNSNDFGLKEIMQDQQGYYLLGFRPTEETFNRNFHHIKITVKRKGVTVRSRAGFYGYTDEQAHPVALSATDQMNRALISPFAPSGVTVRLTTFFVDEAAPGPLLRSFVYLDPHDLTFSEEADGTRVAKIELRGMLFGDNGAVIDQRNQEGTLRFRRDQFEQVLREGIVHGFDLPVKQRGGLQFRIAVRDAGSGHIGAAGQFVEIPDMKKRVLALSGIFPRGFVRRASGPDDQSATQDESLTAGPAVRQFRQGSMIVFGYAIYNARVDDGSVLTAQMRVFRDGRSVFAGDPVPVTVANQTDPMRIIWASALRVGSEMPPGQYLAQIVVANSSNQKSRTASNWIDFEVVK